MEQIGNQPIPLTPVASRPSATFACPLCSKSAWDSDQQAAAILNLAAPFGVIKCTSCGFRALAPQPTSDEYTQLYTMLYFKGSQAEATASWLHDYPAVAYDVSLANRTRFRAYEARLDRLASLFPMPGTLVDIGLAAGDFAEMSMKRGWKVCGLDVSKEACDRATARGIEVHLMDFHTVEWTGRKFDVVHLHHVFEHLLDPNLAISKLKELMHEDSVLVIEVPNQWDSWTRRAINWVKTITGRKSSRTVWSIHHPYFYNQNLLIDFLQTKGFRIISRRTYFPERWSGPLYRKLLQGLDFVADICGGNGENIEIMAKMDSNKSQPAKNG